ncbi:MAG: M20/M25/M40 family metallo-hydrolase [Bacteroidales bacterium]|nr:M20/M25/M40 family metallo-hydrolase [Bacteroidales bacterium]
MKKISLILLSFLFSFTLIADQLVLIPIQNQADLKSYIENPTINVHHIGQNFVIASTVSDVVREATILDYTAWETDENYFIVYGHPNDLEAHFSFNQILASKLFSSEKFAIVKIESSKTATLKPFKNDGMVQIHPTIARWPEATNLLSKRNFEPDPFIVSLLGEVDATNITSIVQHLENYGTRNAYSSQSVEAQNWIKQEFEALGLTVELQDFYMPSGSASDNVIATLTGTKYPEEYVVCGAHYDSYSNGGNAPGADDNASGTAGVLELARILSQYTFDRTIIFCAFSGEEYGLYGSAAYAQSAAQQGMDIHGYFNLDMIGYLQNGSYIHTDLIYPPSAQELADFYMEVSAVYLPDFPIEQGMLVGGDSDHTSFNNNGYMGIFPFEDSDDHSPYIHTSNDLIGPSYNNAEQAKIFTQASLASIVTMANRLNPPRNLVAIPGDSKVNLEWAPLLDAAYFRIYRDDTIIDSTDANSYLDEGLENLQLYTYYITAIYEESGEESYPSNSASATPAPPLALPIFIDFENGLPYWELTEGWGLSTAAYYSSNHSLTESPIGNYTNSTESTATLNALDMSNMTASTLSFWTKFNLETDYDFMYLEITTNGLNWTILETFNGHQSSWTQKFYDLEDYLGLPYVQLRFRFVSDVYVTEEGMFIDDIEITSTYVGMPEKTIKWRFFPNPANEIIYIDGLSSTHTQFLIYNTAGKLVKSGVMNDQDVGINISGLNTGSYILRLSDGLNVIEHTILIHTNR